ncbi:class C sortase [Lacticaseibacillus songhuajiangensis]|uniref:class C sortase n=1 Tax=Lacticaseibacillus songhuajiangensis TaxID=1296539 RepID=UPI000F7A9A8A|nr:class C sortase [Lacticaseibacillus songhuajiangensis]
MKKRQDQTQSVPARKNRHGWLKWFFGTLLVLGAILFFAPIIYDMQQTNQRDKLEESYVKHMYPADAQRDELIRRYNANAHATQQKLAKPYPKLKISQIVKYPKSPIGNITIPAIKLKRMPIYFGDSDEILAKGTGVMPFTSLPSPGKYVTSSVTGHTGMANRVFFDNIRYLKHGDVFYMDVFAHHLAYEVTRIKVIDPTKATAVQNFYVKDAKNKAILMTCTPIGINDHRLLVYGKQIPIKDAKKHATHDRTALSPLQLWQDAIILLLILVLIWWLYCLWRDQRERQAKRQAALIRIASALLARSQQLTEQTRRNDD